MKQNALPLKPLVLRKKEAEIQIGKAINSAAAVNGLPFSELEDILYKYFMECRTGAEKERKDAELAYNRQVSEYQKQKIEQEKEKEVTDNG